MESIWEGARILKTARVFSPSILDIAPQDHQGLFVTYSHASAGSLNIKLNPSPVPCSTGTPASNQGTRDQNATRSLQKIRLQDSHPTEPQANQKLFTT